MHPRLLAHRATLVSSGDPLVERRALDSSRSAAEGAAQGRDSFATTPPIILWFGIGHESKILLVALSAVWSMAVSTYNGARHVDQRLVWSARAMGTPEGKLLWKVVLPAAMPYIFNGMQVALPIALIVAFVFEMVAGGGGLGFLEIMAARFFKSPDLFAALFAILLVGVALDRLLRVIRSRVLVWLEQ